LLSAFIGGKGAARLALPRITGYLVVGLIVGPHLSGLLTRDMVLAGKAIEGLAVVLIALTAGGEIRIDWIRKEARRLVAITGSEIVIALSGVFALVFFGRSLFPFVPDDDLRSAAIIAFVFATMAIANSPMVTIAVISENAAEGPLSRTVLGVVVIMDLCLIVLFAVTLAFAKSALGEEDSGSLGWTLARELGGSILVGIGFGAGIAAFLKHVDRDTPVFVLAICLAMSEISHAFHLEALLVALTAGFWVENFTQNTSGDGVEARSSDSPSTRGEKLIEGIERVSLPVYAVFFSAAGAKLDLGALGTAGPLALLAAAVRVASIWAGARLGARLSKAEPAIERYAWLGLISQAGVVLALATIVGRSFPGWGEQMQVVLIAMIAINQIVGPIGFQYALKRAGEVGAGR